MRLPRRSQTIWYSFLKDETKAGRLPAQLPPLQSGVGSVANAVLAGLKDSDFENINIYSEVLQDAVFDLMDAGKVACASGTSSPFLRQSEKRFMRSLLYTGIRLC